MKVLPLKDACEKITDGTHHSPPIVEKGIPYVTAKHIKKDGIKFFENPWYVSESDHADIYSRCDPRQGDVLYIKDGATTGIAAVNEYDFPFSMLSSVALLRPNPKLCTPEFLTHWLNSPIIKEGNLRRMGGAAIKRLTLAKIKGFQIPLPPLAEQERIAAILDAADALRAKRQQALAHLDDLLQSTFLTLFGDPVTNPMGWEIEALGSLGTLDRGVSKHRPRNEPRLLGGAYPLIQTGDISRSGGYIDSFTSTYSELGLKQSKLWPQGTLCITIAANIADTAILTFDSCFPDSVVGFKPPHPATSEYIRVLVNFIKEILEKKAPQVAQKNINLKILRELPVPAPPLPLQQRFAAIVGKIEAQKSRHRAHLAELDTLFASLQSRAFSGEL